MLRGHAQEGGLPAHRHCRLINTGGQTTERKKPTHHVVAPMRGSQQLQSSIALIDENVPVIVIAPGNDPLFEKTAGNVQEVIARGGNVIFLSDKEGVARMESQAKPMASLILPEVNPFVAPILYSIPVQLLAYHTAVLKGTDVDQPRNLAKSVTVE